jgi:hypothetical protein
MRKDKTNTRAQIAKPIQWFSYFSIIFPSIKSQSLAVKSKIRSQAETLTKQRAELRSA